MENCRHLYRAVGSPEIEHHVCANLESLFPIFDIVLQMHKEQMATISSYGRSNGGIDVQAWASTNFDFDKNFADSRFQEFYLIGKGHKDFKV